MEKRLVQLLGFGPEIGRNLHLYAGCAQSAKPFAGYQRIGIGRRGNDFRDARGEKRVHAWRRAAGVRARFEIYIDGSAARPRAGFFQRQNFRMFQPFPGMETAADDLAILYDHRAHHGVRRRERDALLRQV